MKYNICIEETISGDFEVEANSKEEALEIAKGKYNKCEFVNEPGELLEKRISVKTSKKKDFDLWERF